MVFNVYLIVAALSTTVKFLTVCCCRAENYNTVTNNFLFEKPSGCCGYTDNRLRWYQVIHWVLFLFATELAFAVTIAYWSLLYQKGTKVSGVNANVHLVNGIIALIDILFSGVPVNFWHFVYVVIFGAIYSLFSGIYFATTGDVIYEPVLDYGEHLGLAVGVVIGVLVGVVLIHMLSYLVYLARFWCVYCSCGKEKVGVMDSGSQESDTAPLIKDADPASHTESQEPVAGIV